MIRGVFSFQTQGCPNPSSIPHSPGPRTPHLPCADLHVPGDGAGAEFWQWWCWARLLWRCCREILTGNSFHILGFHLFTSENQMDFLEPQKCHHSQGRKNKWGAWQINPIWEKAAASKAPRAPRGADDRGPVCCKHSRPGQQAFRLLHTWAFSACLSERATWCSTGQMMPYPDWATLHAD